MTLDVTKGLRVMPIQDIPRHQVDVGRVLVATLKQVREAIAQDCPPVLVVVYCDRCGVEHEADYIGETKTVRLAAARAWLVENESWTCDAAGDYCLDCGTAMAVIADTEG